MSNLSMLKSASDCPSLQGTPPTPELLEHFLEGRLPPVEQDWWELHLQRCPSCAARLEALHEPVPTLPVERLLGRAIAVLRLGPRSVPWKILSRMREHLRTQDWLLSEPDEPQSWAVLDVSSRMAEGHPVDSRRLAEGLRSLQSLLLAEPSLGGYLEVGRGLVGFRQVVGPVFERVCDPVVETSLLPGVLTVGQEVVEALQGLGFRFKPSSTGSVLMLHASEAQPLVERAGFWRGLLDGFTARMPSLRVVQRMRGVPSSPTEPDAEVPETIVLKPGQRLHLSLAEDASWPMLLLWQTPTEWRWATTEPLRAGTPLLFELPSEISEARLWSLEASPRLLSHLVTCSLRDIPAEPADLWRQLQAPLQPEVEGVLLRQRANVRQG